MCAMPGSSSLDPLSFSPLDPRGPYGESVRVRVLVQGIVQGVGFRPFVYGLANRLALGGFVRNDPGGVTIEVEGAPPAIDAFLRDLADAAPPLARTAPLSSRFATPPRQARSP